MASPTIEIENAKREFFTRFVDEYGRTCLNPRGKTAKEHFDNENPQLFTGAAMVILKRLKKIDRTYITHQYEVLKMAQVKVGLFGRQRVGKNYGNTISKDEQLGIALQAASAGTSEYVQLIRDMLFYLENNSNTYDDDSPNSGFQLRYWVQPKTMFVLKCVARVEVSFFETMYWCAAALVTVAKGKKSGKSGHHMLLLVILMLENEAISIPNTAVSTIALIKKFYVKKRGSNWARSIIDEYYLNKKHPFHTLSKYLY